MSDIGNKYSRVNVLESGEAMAQIHWHYALCNTRHKIFHGNTTADEYWTMYPDGIAVRRAVVWPENESAFGGNPLLWSLTEWLLINGKGTTPEDNLEKDNAFAVQNLAGEKITFPWPPTDFFAPICKTHPEIAGWGEYIGTIHVKGKPNPFVLIPNNKALFPHPPCPTCGQDHLEIFSGAGGSYSHWPLYDKEYIGYIPAGDSVGPVPTHAALGMVGISVPSFSLPRPCTFICLTGAAEQSPPQLAEIAASWLRPAIIECPPGLSTRSASGDSIGLTPYVGYAFSERAYTFRMWSEDKLKLVMKPRTTVVNPVLKIDGLSYTKARVWLNGTPLDDDEYKSQCTGGMLIVWIDKNIQEPTEIEIRG